MTPVKSILLAHGRRSFICAAVLLCAGIGVSVYMRHASFREGSDTYGWFGDDWRLSGGGGSLSDEEVLRYRDYMAGGSREEELYKMAAAEVPEIREAAEKGDPIAQCRMGHACSEGIGVPKDDVQAAQWFRRSADEGFGRAERALAWCYREGKGVPQDSGQAQRLYKRAADHGDSVAAQEAFSMYMQEASEEERKERDARFKWEMLRSSLMAAGLSLFGLCLHDVWARRRMRREMAEAELRARAVRTLCDLKDAPKCVRPGMRGHEGDAGR